jgi:hypothetical protein
MAVIPDEYVPATTTDPVTTLVAVTLPFKSTVNTFCANAGDASATTSRSISVHHGSANPRRLSRDAWPEAVVSATGGRPRGQFRYNG